MKKLLISIIPAGTGAVFRTNTRNTMPLYSMPTESRS